MKTILTLLLISPHFLLSHPASGSQPIQPELFDTTYSLPTGGTTIYVNAGDDLQAAIDSAVSGDVIVLEAGATFTGNFRPPHKAGEDWIYIISSELDQLPTDERIGLDDAVNMPKLEIGRAHV